MNKQEIETKKLLSNYIDSERKLLRHLDEKENGDGECNCNNREIIRTIFEGEFPEIQERCLNCGGYT